MKSDDQLLGLGWYRVAVSMAMLTCSASSFAEDASCTMLLNALSRSVITPYHSYFTMNMAAAGGNSISGEKINTGTVLYEIEDGKWQQSEVTPQEEKNQMEKSRKTSKASCQFVRDETVDGITASLYSMNENGVDAKIWVAKTNGLPVHETMDAQSFKSDTRFIYGAVTPPKTN